MTERDGRLLAAVRQLAWDELTSFEEDFAVEPVPRAQEMRAGTIALLAIVLPEAFEDALKEALSARLLSWHDAADYRVDGWFRVAALDCAQFALSGERTRLEPLVVNIDHHNSRLRAYVLECLAFIAPLLSFGDPEVRSRVESVLRDALFYGDGAVAVHLVGTGPLEDKVAWANQWSERVRPAFGREQLTAAATNGWLTNALHEGLLEIERYTWSRVIEQLASGCLSPEVQLPLATEPTTLLRDRLTAHPLMNPTFRIPA